MIGMCLRRMLRPYAAPAHTATFMAWLRRMLRPRPLRSYAGLAAGRASRTFVKSAVPAR